MKSLLLFTLSFCVVTAQTAFSQKQETTFQISTGYQYARKSLDDGWVGGVGVSHKKIMVSLLVGYRPVLPRTVFGDLGLGYAVYDKAYFKCYIETQGIFFFRPDYLIFDSFYFKQSLGIGIYSKPWNGFSLAYSFMPLTSYYNTRKDHPNFRKLTFFDRMGFQVKLFLNF